MIPLRGFLAKILAFSIESFDIDFFQGTWLFPLAILLRIWAKIYKRKINCTFLRILTFPKNLGYFRILAKTYLYGWIGMKYFTCFSLKYESYWGNLLQKWVMSKKKGITYFDCNLLQKVGNLFEKSKIFQCRL